MAEQFDIGVGTVNHHLKEIYDEVELSPEELQVLHRIVNLYIEYAELQALERLPRTMRDWIKKLDEFLKASGRRPLDHAGTISAEAAKTKAEREHERYQARERRQATRD